MVVANEQMEKMMSGMMNACGDMNMMTNNTMNAMTQSMTALTKGYEEMFSCMSNMMRTCIENSMATSRSMLSAKSIQDAMETQTNAMKSQSEFMMSEVNKLSVLSSRIAQETMAPVASQMTTAMSKATNMARAA